MELLQGALVARSGKAAYATLRMNVYITIEEGAEMMGVALLIRTLLVHLANEEVPRLVLRFNGRPAPGINAGNPSATSVSLPSPGT